MAVLKTTRTLILELPFNTYCTTYRRIWPKHKETLLQCNKCRALAFELRILARDKKYISISIILLLRNVLRTFLRGDKKPPSSLSTTKQSLLLIYNMHLSTLEQKHALNISMSLRVSSRRLQTYGSIFFRLYESWCFVGQSFVGTYLYLLV